MANEKKSIITILADTSKFEESLKRIKDSTKELFDSLNKVKEPNLKTDKAKKDIDNLKDSVDDLKNSTEKSMEPNINTDKAKESIDFLANDVKWLETRIKSRHQLNLVIDSYNQQIRDAQDRLKGLQRNTEEAQKLRLDIQGFKDNMKLARDEFKSFENAWKSSFQKIQEWLDRLWVWFLATKWGMLAAAWAFVYKSLTKAEDFAVKYSQETGANWYDASQAYMSITWAAAKKWFDKLDYMNSFLALTQAGLIKNNDFNSEIIGQATASKDKYDPGAYASTIKALMTSYWSELGTAQDASSFFYGLTRQGGVTDTRKELTDVLTEYLPVMKQRGLSLDQVTGMLVEGSKAWVFSVDKTLDLPKEFLWAKISDTFATGNVAKLQALSSLIGDEDLVKLRNDYNTWRKTAAEIWKSVLDKTQGLWAAQKMKFLLDFGGTQAEDLADTGTEKILKWLNAWKWTVTGVIIKWESAYKNTQEMKWDTVTYWMWKWGAVLDAVWGSVQQEIMQKNNRGDIRWTAPIEINYNTYNYGSDVSKKTTEQKVAELRARNAK